MVLRTWRVVGKGSPHYATKTGERVMTVTLKDIEKMLKVSETDNITHTQERAFIVAVVKVLPSLIAALREARKQMELYSTGEEGAGYYDVLNKLRELDGE